LQIDDRVKKLITFNELNLMAQWPFKGQFDVIFCRNVVIYVDEPTQVKIWNRFAGLMPLGGHLYIGHSERVSGPAKDEFDNIGITTYRYIGKSGRRTA
jgi:chemotaxis protein methyltransferase CheR